MSTATDQAGSATTIAVDDDERMVRVNRLVKRYPGRPVNAVDGVSFEVVRGEVFGLLGPNGAGKTTTIGVLTTRVRPTAGGAVLAGVDVVADPVRARQVLAVVPQRPNLDRQLSARRNLLFHAAYFGVPPAVRTARAEALLAELGLADRADDSVNKLSGGQAQRLMIARALMHQPRVLFLDEPTTGLDPQARLFVWDRVRGLRDNGVTIVLTTHDMDEAATLADRVGIMDSGRLLALDTPAALTNLLPDQTTLALTVQPEPGSRPEDVPALLAGLTAIDGVARVETDGDGPSSGSAQTGAADRPPLRLRLYCTAEAATLVAPAVQTVLRFGAEPRDVRLGHPSLEDVFIHLTGRGLRG
jgi:ABC-2 type transport system ATP-binding protein